MNSIEMLTYIMDKFALTLCPFLIIGNSAITYGAFILSNDEEFISDTGVPELPLKLLLCILILIPGLTTLFSTWILIEKICVIFSFTNF